ADRVVVGEQAGDVAAHAGQAVLDQAVGAPGVADDVARCPVHAAAVAVHEEVTLQAVGQAEDDFAAGVGEAAGARGGAEGALEDVLPPGAVTEIVTTPVGAVGRVVALEHAVVLGDPGAVEAGAGGVVVLEVGRHVHLQQALEGAVGAGQLQEVVVERRPGGGGHEPVATQVRPAAAGQVRTRPGGGAPLGQAVGVGGRQAVPGAGGPFVFAEVD